MPAQNVSSTEKALSRPACSRWNSVCFEGGGRPQPLWLGKERADVPARRRQQWNPIPRFSKGEYDYDPVQTGEMNEVDGFSIANEVSGK